MGKFFSIILLIFSLTGVQTDARVLSGSRTERKLNQKIERLLNSARKQYDSGKVQQALDSYWKILELDPAETFAYLELGEIYYELKIYDRAIELLEPGCKSAEREMDPETVCHYYCILTNAYVQLNQLGLASKALIKAAEASPKNPLPRKILGDIYLANNRIKSAYKAYKKALTFDPNYEPALQKIGELSTRYAKELSSKETATKPAAAKPAPVRPMPTPKPVPVPGKTEPEREESAKTEIEEPEVEEMEVSSDTILPLPKPMPAKPTAETNVVAKPEPTEPAKPAQTQTSPQTPSQTQPAAAAAAVPAPTTENEVPKASQAEIEEQLDKLLAGTAEQKKDATAFFVSLEAEGLTEVEELLYDSDPEVRTIAVRALSAFSKYKDKVKNILNDSVDDPDPEVQKEVRAILGSL